MNNAICIKLKNFSFVGRFPELCVYCGKPKTNDMVHTLKKSEKGNDENVTHKIELRIPYCEQHSKIALRNKTVNTIVFSVCFTISFLLAAIVAAFFFIGVINDGMFGVKGGPFLLVLAALSAGGGALIAFWIVFAPLSFLSLPIINKFSPYTFQHPLGVIIKNPKDTDTIEIEIKNTDIEKKFIEINSEIISQENSKDNLI